MNRPQYDVIIIGTGAGGGTLAARLAPTGKRILVLERGGFLPREKANWDAREVFQHDRYHNAETWLDRAGKPFHPGTGYFVGGNTKVYGAALLRLRERDFDEVRHKSGISPRWPIGYAELEPYYTQAEALYGVHGRRGLDPTEPAMSHEYPHPPVSHEPRIQELFDGLVDQGLHPFPLPLAVRLDETDPQNSACIRCDTCDGFPCMVDAKGDADVTCVRPAMRQNNVDLVTHAKVIRLETDASGREIREVVAEVDGKEVRYRGDVVAVCCGAINSAALLLRSANDRHPHGLANRSGQVGRNFMKHYSAAMLGISRKRNTTSFQKTIGVNDFYWGDDDYDYPMGHAQLLGKISRDMLVADAPRFAPGFALETMADHAVGWWFTGEDLPHAENRVRLDGEHIVVEYQDFDISPFKRLLSRFQSILKRVDCGDHVIPCSVYLHKTIPLEAVGHQCGTLRFGDDPTSSVLDVHCRAHDVDNLYVVDGSFFPSSAAVNPSLTIMANALRVGDHLRERLS